MAAVTDEDDLRSKISGEVESLFDMGYSADEAVSYYQKHLDALDSKMWNSLLSSVGYVTIIMAMLAVLEIVDKEHHSVYAIGWVLVASVFFLSSCSVFLILKMVSKPEWYLFSVSGTPVDRIMRYSIEMAKVREDRTRLLQRAYKFNLGVLSLGMLFVIWWGVSKLWHPACLEWLYLPIHTF